MRSRKFRALLYVSLAVVPGAFGCGSDLAAPTVVPGQNIATFAITSADALVLSINQSALLIADIRDNSGTTVRAAAVVWTSSDSSIVRIDRTNNVPRAINATAIRAGTATITAMTGERKAVVTLTVRAPGPVASLVLTSPVSLALGASFQLATVLRDSSAVVLTEPVVLFASSDVSIVSVSGTGLITALAAGTVTLTATSSGKSASAVLTIFAASHAFVWTAENGMTDLGVLPGFLSSKANAVSAAGHIAGTMSTLTTSRAFVRSPGTNGEIRLLDGLSSGGASEAFGVNSSGQVVGYAAGSDGVRHAVLWSADGTLQLLGTLPGSSGSIALGINDRGDVVGQSQNGDRPQPFTWRVGEGMRSVFNASTGKAYAINSSGLIAGQFQEQPYLLGVNGSQFALPVADGDILGSAVALSSLGDAVGASTACVGTVYSYFDDDCTTTVDRPVLWLKGTGPVDLRGGASAPTALARATGINASRQVVGVTYGQRAVLWTQTGSRDLGTLSGRAQSIALAINDAGVVVGWSGNP